MAQLKDMTRIQVLKQIDLQKRLNDEVGRAIWLNTTLANIGDFLTQPRTIKENLHPFENALFALQDGFKKKTLTSAFVDSVYFVITRNRRSRECWCRYLGLCSPSSRPMASNRNLTRARGAGNYG